MKRELFQLPSSRHSPHGRASRPRRPRRRRTATTSTPTRTEWFNNRAGTITQEASGYNNPGVYASGIASASGSGHARLDEQRAD